MDAGMRGVALQLLFEWGFPWTDCSVERRGKYFNLTFTKGEERRDDFLFEWSGAGYKLNGMLNESGEWEPFVAEGEIGIKAEEFLHAIAKAMTDAGFKPDPGSLDEM